MALLSSADAIAALTAAGWTAYKSPARANGRCQTLCYVVGGQPVNLGRLRQLAREVLSPAAEPVATEPPAAAEPEGGRPVRSFQPGSADGLYLAGDGIDLWAFGSEALARKAALAFEADGAEPYLAGPGPLGHPVALPLTAAAAPVAPEPAVSAAPVVAPYDVARLGFATFNPETEGLSEDPADCYAPGTGPAAGRLSPRAVPAHPWDPGTPAARERVALQGERVAILWPIAQALRGAGVALPPSWATDGPVMAGELSLNAALALLPLGAIAQAAAALAALPPVTTAQDLALALCDTGAVPGRPYL